MLWKLISHSMNRVTPLMVFLVLLFRKTSSKNSRTWRVLSTKSKKSMMMRRNASSAGIVQLLLLTHFSAHANVLVLLVLFILNAWEVGLTSRSNRKLALTFHPSIGRHSNVRFARKPIHWWSSHKVWLTTLSIMKSLRVIFLCLKVWIKRRITQELSTSFVQLESKTHLNWAEVMSLTCASMISVSHVAMLWLSLRITSSCSKIT